MGIRIPSFVSFVLSEVTDDDIVKPVVGRGDILLAFERVAFLLPSGKFLSESEWFLVHLNSWGDGVVDVIAASRWVLFLYELQS